MKQKIIQVVAFILVLFVCFPGTAPARQIYSGLFGLWAYPRWEEGLQLIKDNGFGIVIIDGNKERIARAQKQGLKCIVDFKFSMETVQDPIKWEKYKKELQKTVIQLRDNPAVFAWYPVDEADGQGIPIAYVKEVIKLIKSLDPSRPIFTVFDTPDKWKSYLPYFDIICVDPYLLKRNPATGKADTVDKVRDWLRKVKSDLEELKVKRPVWVALHGFEFIPRVPGIKDWYQIVTPAQFNDMVNISLAEDVNGILVYTMAATNDHDYQDWILPVNDPKLWDAVRKMPQKLEHSKGQ